MSREVDPALSHMPTPAWAKRHEKGHAREEESVKKLLLREEVMVEKEHKRELKAAEQAGRLLASPGTPSWAQDGKVPRHFLCRSCLQWL